MSLTVRSSHLLAARVKALGFCGMMAELFIDNIRSLYLMYMLFCR